MFLCKYYIAFSVGVESDCDKIKIIELIARTESVFEWRVNKWVKVFWYEGKEMKVHVVEYVRIIFTQTKGSYKSDTVPNLSVF